MISGKLRSERAHFEKYVAGVVPKSGETADKMVRRATTDVLLKMGLYGVKVSIAIKNAIQPEFELKTVEPSAPVEESAKEAGAEEKQTTTTQTKEEAPRSSRRSSTSKKEQRKEDETNQN